MSDVLAEPLPALRDELAIVRAHLRGDADRTAVGENAAEGEGSPLDRLAQRFGLSPFERLLLVMVLGPEIDPSFRDDLQRRTVSPHPTFAAALAVLPDPHWSALTPDGPLRRWQMVRLLDPTSLTSSPLTVDESVLHHLLGAGAIDERVAALTVEHQGRLVRSPTTVALATQIVAAWQRRQPVWVDGPQRGNVDAVAHAAATALGWRLLAVPSSRLPDDPQERQSTLRLLEREAALHGLAWLVGMDRAPDHAGSQGADIVRLDAPVALVASHPGPGHAPQESALGTGDLLRLHMPRLSVNERSAALRGSLRRYGLNGQHAARAAHVAALADLSLGDLDAAARESAHGADLATAVRQRARRGLDGLARLVEPSATWDDLVLPEQRLAQLHSLAASVRQRGRVMDDWGFAARSSLGVGTAALFSGPSGTGKTLAAEALAADLGLDLVVVDLSQAVSKYIGETEKNLARLFDASEDAGAVLLFDEADALFGKRTEVRDSHDRYANIGVSYLLTRMESFRGLCVLTTNARSNLDPAFVRRIRTIVTFPYPDRDARAAIWARAFPAQVPRRDVDPDELADLDLSGGGIASAALTAAYLGAERGEVTMDDLAAATRWELAKSGRSSPAR